MNDLALAVYLLIGFAFLIIAALIVLNEIIYRASRRAVRDGIRDAVEGDQHENP